MSKYYIDTDAGFDLDKLTQAIRDEEKLFAEFQSGQFFTAPDGVRVNHHLFDERDSRPHPEVTFVIKGSAHPATTGLIWEGRLLVNSTEEEVEAYR